MSIHKSLKTSGNLVRQRSVLKRIERLQILKKTGDWTEEKSVFGLRKVKNPELFKRIKKKKKEEEEEVTGTEE